MKQRISTCVGLALLLASALVQPVSAEEASVQSIGMGEVRALALRKSPVVLALDSEYATHIAEAAEIELLPNPELEASVSVPVDWSERRGDNEFELSVSQPLRLSYFGTREAVAAVMKRAASSEQQAALFKLLKEVDLAYVRLWSLQEQRRSLESARRSAATRSRGVSDGASRGVYSDGDKKLFAGAAALIEAELLGVEGDIKATNGKLLGLIGASLAKYELTKPALASRLVLEEVQAKERASAIGVSQRTELLAELAAKQSTLARRDAFPEFTPQLTTSRSDDGTTFIGAGFSVPLPFRDRNQNQILQRDAELKAVRAKRDYGHSSEFQEEIASIVDAANLAMDEATLFETRIVPAFRDSLQFQEKQFAAGNGSLLQIWQTQRELFETQSKSLERWTKAFALRIELEILIGEEL